MAKGFTHESTYNESKEWYTPRYIFQALNVNFDLDPCSPGQEVVPWIPTQYHYTYFDDGLNKNWFGNCWVNPPYGSDTPQWMARLSEHDEGIALVFARCDTQWFHLYAPLATAICFISGRVQFVPSEKSELYADAQYKPKGGCGAGSMLIAYGKENAEALVRSGLGLTLPVIRPVVDGRTGERFGSVPSRDNENSSQNAESRQGTLFGGKNGKEKTAKI
ncbi:MAG TPA: adenine methyltransferase [bacterium]|nr:adenine methyltransferase [bacterium]